MKKRGISIEIPRFGIREIHTIVSDYTGTLSCHGRLTPGVKKCLRKLMRSVDIRIVTSDSYGTARKQLKGIVSPHFLKEGRHDLQKQEYVRQLNPRYVAAFGNGNNDRLLLKTVKKAGGLAIAVDNGEGCAVDALHNAHLCVVGAVHALQLLLIPKGCKATLRY
jgi:soluble P-type ATPase